MPLADRISGLLLAAIAAGLLGCSAAAQKVPADSARPVVLFVPGYKGSALRDTETKRRIWITAREELFGDRSLALDLPELGFSSGGSLEVDGVLERVSVLPGLISVDAYGTWLRALRRIVGNYADVRTFAYDWRKDNVHTASLLAERITDLRRSGVPKVVIVAHSMGGLIASYYLRYGASPLDEAQERWPRAVDGAVLLGTPFLGAAAVFRDMQIGSYNSFNRTLLNQRAVASFPSSYQLLPPPNASMLQNADGAALQHLVFSARAWQRLKWGLLKESKLSESQRRGRARYTARQLARAAELYRRLHAPIERAPARALPVLNILGTGRPTLARVLLAGDKQTPRLAFNRKTLAEAGLPASEAAVAGDGDSVVRTASARLPEAMRRACRAESTIITAEHSKLGTDREALRRMQQFLLPLLRGE